MKTKISTLLVSAICLMASVSFISCNNENKDKTPPVINLNAPEDGAVLSIGSDVHFDVELSDNEMLASYEVEIRSNFNKDKSTESSTSKGDKTTRFSFQKSWDLSESEVYIHHHEIIISEDATPGNYSFAIYCVDAAGNKSHITRNIELVRYE
jgi:hypothetical protein